MFSAQLHTQTNKNFRYLKRCNLLKFIILDDHLNLLLDFKYNKLYAENFDQFPFMVSIFISSYLLIIRQ